MDCFIISSSHGSLNYFPSQFPFSLRYAPPLEVGAHTLLSCRMLISCCFFVRSGDLSCFCNIYPATFSFWSCVAMAHS